MVVNGDGMPICSHIYRGNQSEPETMEDTMKRLMNRLHGSSQIPLEKPTVAMDRGIATDKNVTWIRENGYHYIVIKREDDCEVYRQLFENQRDTFELVSSKKSIYGEDNNVYVYKSPFASEDITCKILCYSEGKERKEQAIADKKGNPFLDDIEALRKSIRKGTIKNKGKIINKLQRITVKNGRKANAFNTTIVADGDKVTDISVERRELRTGEPFHWQTEQSRSLCKLST
jgi:transposase